LKGKLLMVTRAEVAPLPAGSYYVFDIIGLEVYDEAGTLLGKVNDVLVTGSNDVYIVEKADDKPLLIPAIKDVVKLIDIDGRRIVVKLQEEWE